MTSKIVVPEMGESVVEATVSRWLKKEGDAVSVGEPVVELETDKVDLEVGAEEEGTLQKIEAKEGADVKVGDLLGVISSNGASAPKERPQEEKRPAKTKEEQKGRGETEGEPPKEQRAARAREEGVEKDAGARPEGEPAAPARKEPTASPLARRIAEEHGLSLKDVRPGAHDRITKEDVERTVRAEEERKERPQRAPARAGRTERREKMSRRRRTIARRLVEAQQAAAMLTTFNEVDLAAMLAFRSRNRDRFAERFGVKLGLMSFFVKACIGALREFPRLNATIDGDEIVYKEYYDIGVAVGAEDGLVVPVLRDADSMSFADIERTIRELTEAARGNTLTLDDLRGGTFSLTNGGVFGSMLSTPILNPPQVAILGMHKIEERPIALGGVVVIHPMMYLALTYDHRIVDGREAVQFLVRVKELLEDPEKLMLEG